MMYRLWDAAENRMYAEGQSKHRYSSNTPIVMLSINRKDANGVEIFEHDIVHVNSAYFVVSMYEELPGYSTTKVVDSRSWGWEDCVVVGNIHEDTEMLPFVM